MSLPTAIALLGLLAFPHSRQQDVEVVVWRAAPGTVSGAIVDARGASIAGAQLRLWIREREAPREIGAAASDSNGRFELRWQLPRWNDAHARATLIATAPGLATTRVDNVLLTPTPSDLGVVRLHEPATLSGRVRTRSGQPIAGARVYGVVGPVSGAQPELWNSEPIATTDESGAYSCRVLGPGRVTLGAGAIGFADAADCALTLAPLASNTQDFVLSAERVATLRVTSELLEPLAQAEVGPAGEASGVAPHFEYSATRAFWRGPLRVDAHGGFARIEGLSREHAAHARIRARGYRDVFVPLASAELTVRLTPVTWIDVRASRIRGDAPVELHQVRVRDGSLPSSWCGLAEDAAWRALVEDSAAVEKLAPDRWRIAWNSAECLVEGGAPQHVVAWARDGSIASQALEAAWGERALDCRLRFEPPTEVTGVVRDTAGRPVALRIGAQIGVDPPAFVTATSDASGRFRFPALGRELQWLGAHDPRWELRSRLDASRSPRDRRWKTLSSS